MYTRCSAAADLYYLNEVLSLWILSLWDFISKSRVNSSSWIFFVTCFLYSWHQHQTNRSNIWINHVWRFEVNWNTKFRRILVSPNLEDRELYDFLLSVNQQYYRPLIEIGTTTLHRGATTVHQVDGAKECRGSWEHNSRGKDSRRPHLYVNLPSAPRKLPAPLARGAPTVEEKEEDRWTRLPPPSPFARLVYGLETSRLARLQPGGPHQRKRLRDICSRDWK